ncbi:MAG TPA: peptidylprolyl isomerase [Stellaceae bacterium]|nr:peptidylprolyl isomerase [Stellaceae bacterium]
MFLPSPSRTLRPLLLALALAAPVAAMAADSPAKPAAPPAAAAPAAPAKDPVIAVVNGKQFHASDLATLRQELGPQAQRVDYRRLLDQLVAQSLVEQAARTDKLDADPDVKKTMALLESRVLFQEYLRRAVEKGTSDAALKAKYEEDKKSAGGVEEEVHARHILLKTEDEAKAVIAQLDAGGDFAKIADEKSQDKNESGGDLGYFTRDKMVKEFSDAAFAMTPGTYSKTPVKSKFGYHVIKVEDRRPVSFDEIKEDLHDKVAKEIVLAKIADLKKKAKVEEFNEDGSPLSAPPAEPPPLEPSP